MSYADERTVPSMEHLRRVGCRSSHLRFGRTPDLRQVTDRYRRSEKAEWVAEGADVRKRLRKKRYIAEYTVYGFEVSFTISPDLSTSARAELIDRFIREAIEDHGLQFGGGGGDEWSGFAIVNQSRVSATDEHRTSVKRWLDHMPNVSNIRVGSHRDAYDGWEQEWNNLARDTEREAN